MDFVNARGSESASAIRSVLTALIADRSAWTYVEMPEIRRPRGYADLATGFAMPAYGPEVS